MTSPASPKKIIPAGQPRCANAKGSGAYAASMAVRGKPWAITLFKSWGAVQVKQQRSGHRHNMSVPVLAYS